MNGKKLQKTDISESMTSLTYNFPIDPLAAFTSGRNMMTADVPPGGGGPGICVHWPNFQIIAQYRDPGVGVIPPASAPPRMGRAFFASAAMAHTGRPGRAFDLYTPGGQRIATLVAGNGGALHGEKELRHTGAMIARERGGKGPAVAVAVVRLSV